MRQTLQHAQQFALSAADLSDAVDKKNGRHCLIAQDKRVRVRGLRIAPTRKLNMTGEHCTAAANSAKASFQSVSSDSKIPPSHRYGQAVRNSNSICSYVCKLSGIKMSI